MKPVSFEYERPADLKGALSLLGEDGPVVKVLAGGQSLGPMLNLRLVRPELLVDVTRIADLKRVEEHADGVVIGACVTHADMEDRRVPDVTRGALPAVARDIAYRAVRNRGTVGGSLAHADPSAELPLAAQVLEARLVLRSTAGTRTVPAAEFFVGLLTTALEADECIEEIHWPAWNDRAGCAFTEVSRRHGDFAIVEACAQIALDDDGRCTRVAFGLGGGGAKPLSFPVLAERLIGTRLDDNAVRSVAYDAAAELDPTSDLHASAAYRKHLAAVLAARVLREAYAEAREKS